MRKLRRFFLLILSVVLVSPLFSGCNDDELDGCGLTVVVKDAAKPSRRLPNASIVISQGSGGIRQDGKSDANGTAYFFFDNEAIFNIDVTFTENGVPRRGKSTVRLEYGKTVSKDVLVSE